MYTLIYTIQLNYMSRAGYDPVVYYTSPGLGQKYVIATLNNELVCSHPTVKSFILLV